MFAAFYFNRSRSRIDKRPLIILLLQLMSIKRKKGKEKKKKTTKWCETCDIALLPCNFISPFPDLKMTALAIHNLQYLFKKCYEK
jgi:hypothetical protein